MKNILFKYMHFQLSSYTCCTVIETCYVTKYYKLCFSVYLKMSIFKSFLKTMLRNAYILPFYFQFYNFFFLWNWWLIQIFFFYNRSFMLIYNTVGYVYILYFSLYYIIKYIFMIFFFFNENNKNSMVLWRIITIVISMLTMKV